MRTSNRPLGQAVLAVWICISAGLMSGWVQASSQGQAVPGDPYLNTQVIEPAGEEGKVGEPNLIRKVEPRFPRKASKAGVKEATVVLHFTIDKRGRTGGFEVLRTTKPGYGFVKAAIKAVKKWRYRPGTVDGEPTVVYTTVVMKFKKKQCDA